MPTSDETTPSKAASRPAAVLVIDDDADIRLTIAGVLEEAGFDVAVAGGAREGLVYLRSHPAPKLILLDLSMPEMDGADFRQEQTKDLALRSIPTLVLTAAARAAEKVAPLGVDGWLEKPVDLDRLIATVARYCGRPG